MPLPVNSTLIMQGQPRPGDVMHTKPKQAMLIRMSAETFEAMSDIQNPPKLQFEFGDKPGIYIGNTFHSVKANSEQSDHELYLRLASAQKPMAPLKFYANVVGKFMVERQLGEKVQETVRDRTIEAEKQRTERKTLFIDSASKLNNTVSKAKGKREPVTVRRTTVLSSNQAPPASRVPPLPTSVSTGSSSDVPPTRARLIHCLALKPRTADVATMMCVGKDPTPRMKAEMMNLLQAVAEPVPVSKTSDPDAPQRWQLRLESWREVRPYQWPTLTPEERLQLSRQARTSFKDLRIPETDPIWEYVRYQPDQAPGASSKSGGPAVEKNGVILKTSKKSRIAEGTRKKASDTPIPSKDESGKGKARDMDQGSTAGPSTSTSARVPGRRLPGSGFRVKPSVTPPLSDLRRTNSPVPKREPAASPGPSSSARPQESRSAPVTVAATQVRKKVRDGQTISSTQRNHERKREETPRVRDRDHAIAEKPRLKERDSPMPAPLPSFKRKKPPRDEEESERSEGEIPLSASVPKKRKVHDESTTSAEKSRVRDLSLPKKPVANDPTTIRVKIKKEPSPLSSAFSPPPPPTPVRSSIPSRTFAVDKQNSSYSSSARSPKPSQAQRSPGKGRRKSPIYTSSESESDTGAPAVSRSRASVAAQARSPLQEEPPTKRFKAAAMYMQRFKPRPLPSDRGGLRKYYSSCYKIYSALSSEQSQRRNRIKRMLQEAEGDERERGEETDEDFEDLTPEVVVALMDELGAVTDELHKVRQTWERLGGKVHSSGELVDE